MFYLLGKKFLFAGLLLSCSLAQAAPLECPINAPADWGVPAARLDRARVLGGQTSAIPDREWQMGGTLYQSWNMKAKSRSMNRQVDCLYAGTPRFVRLDARRVGRCMAKRRVRADTLMAGSMEFRCR